jgi:hypothetical protein
MFNGDSVSGLAWRRANRLKTLKNRGMTRIRPAGFRAGPVFFLPVGLAENAHAVQKTTS